MVLIDAPSIKVSSLGEWCVASHEFVTKIRHDVPNPSLLSLIGRGTTVTGKSLL